MPSIFKEGTELPQNAQESKVREYTRGKGIYWVWGTDKGQMCCSGLCWPKEKGCEKQSKDLVSHPGFMRT